MGEFFVYSFFFGMLLYLFPVFFFAEGYLDVRDNRCWFALSLFRYFKVFGGYAQLSKEGFVFHLTKKKAVILPYSSMVEARKKLEITQGFQLWRFHQIVEIRGADEPYGALVAATIQGTSAQVFSVLKTKHPFLSLKNSTVLVNRSTLKVSVQTVLVFNGLVLTVALTKKILEVIINWTRKRKSTASWKKQRSS